MRHLVPLTLLIVLGLARPVAAEQPLVFQATDLSHDFDGFGVQAWAGDVSIEPILRDMNVKLVRMSLSNFLSPMNVDGWGDAEYDRHYQQQSWEPYQKSWQLLKKYDVRLVANLFGAPSNWKIDQPRKGSLDPKHYSHLAKAMAAALAALIKSGVKPAGIEMLNEPDGDWNCYLPPEGYNQLVKMLRKELDARGLQRLMIVGPGLAHIDHFSHVPWIDSLDAAGVKAIGVWSTHGYQWDKTLNRDPDYARVSFLSGFRASYVEKGGATAKPVWVTEYGPYSCFDDRDTPIENADFAARSVQDALTFLICGATGVFFWEAADPPWSHLHCGLIRKDETPRPVYFAMQSVFANWPAGGQVLQSPQQPRDDVYGAAVYSAKNKTITVSLVNCTAAVRRKAVVLAGIRSPRVVRCDGFERDRPISWQLKMAASGGFTVELPPYSTRTVVIAVGGMSRDAKSSTRN